MKKSSVDHPSEGRRKGLQRYASKDGHKNGVAIRCEKQAGVLLHNILQLPSSISNRKWLHNRNYFAASFFN
ncbi:unnamed protein product [Rhodiola kirilowii]